MKHALSSGLAMVAAAGLVFAACDQNTVAPDGAEAFDGPSIAFAVAGAVNAEEYEVCKFGPTATFDYTVVVVNPAADPTLVNESGQFQLSDGQCRVIGVWGGFGVYVTVTERTDLFTGNEQLDKIDVTTADYSVTPTVISTTTLTGTNVVPQTQIAGGPGGGPNGLLAEFYNSTPTGGEGCTPGYWKQEQHFDSWPAGVDPDDLFTSLGFEDAYPGMTLLDVLQNNGNKTGLEALGRHTVAAYLNSQTVSYAFTNVVTMFNNVYPADKQAYNTLKGQFATENESGCPLN